VQPPLAPPALSACSPQQYAVAFLQVLQKYVRRTLQLAVRTPLTSQRAPKSDQTGTRGGGGAAQPAGTTFSHASRQGHGDNVGEIAQKYQFFLAQTYVCLVSARSDMTGSVWQIKYNIYYRMWRTHTPSEDGGTEISSCQQRGIHLSFFGHGKPGTMGTMAPKSGSYSTNEGPAR
jgi:hypothetical protein